jgi:hypothetical protein
MDPARFVFLDETGASTNMVRRYGRCARGERLVDAAPWGHWKTITFVVGLRQRDYRLGGAERLRSPQLSI